MTPEELMRPRVKVVNKWPNCPYEVDDILIQDGDCYRVIRDILWRGAVTKQDVEPHPYLIRPLEWWEDRKEEDMCDYIKYKDKIFKVYIPVTIYNGWLWIEGEGIRELQLNKVIPSSYEEYTTYINSLKQTEQQTNT